MSFRNIIIFWVFIFYALFSVFIFYYFNNSYLKNTIEKFKSENIYSTSVVNKFIEEEKKQLLKNARTMATDDIAYWGFTSNRYIGIGGRWKLDNNTMKITTKKMTRINFIRLANLLRNRVFGYGRGSEPKGVQLFNNKFKLVGKSAEIPKASIDTGNESYIRSVISTKNMGGTEIKTIQKNKGSYFIKAFSPVGRNSIWPTDNPPGIIGVTANLDGNYLDGIKNNINKELILINKDEIITSTIFDGQKRVANMRINLNIIDSTDSFYYKEVEDIINRKIGFHFLPLKNFDKEIIGYIGVGFYIDEVFEMYNKNVKKFIPIEIGSIVILSLLIYGVLFYLFRPFNNIMIGIKLVGEGNYDKKIETKATGELKLIKDNINILSDSVKEREESLKDLNQEIKEKNIRLIELDKLKDDFLANTSHELRTPLNGIIGIADSLIDGATGILPKMTTDNLNMIVTSGKRLVGLVNEILDFSKIQKQELSVMIENVDLYLIVEEAISFLNYIVKEKNLKIENNVRREVPYIRADKERIRQILNNIIGNAIKFTEEGTIDITEFEKDGYLNIVIKDTGIGIEKDKFEKIFRSFEQLERSDDRNYGGTGLGLPISKQLVELQNGNIYVESEVNKGSKFIFTIPLSQDKKLKLPENTSVKESNKSEKLALMDVLEKIDFDAKNKGEILVVDDEPVNIQVLMNYLVIEGYSVSIAMNGIEALKIMKNKKKYFDLLILDVMMPKMSGFEVCQKVREDYTLFDLPILMLTAKNMTKDIVDGIKSGANDYISKPFEKEELLARVDMFINLKKISEKEKLVTSKLKKWNVVLEKEIKNKIKGIKNLLDNIDYGVLSFGEDLVIKKDYSKGCVDIFNINIEGKNYIDLISSSMNKEELEIMEETFGKLFKISNESMFDVFINLLPEEIIINKKIIEVKYKMVEKEIMIILNDVTKNRKLEKMIQVQKSNVKKMSTIIKYSNEFYLLIEKVEKFNKTDLLEILDSKEDFETRKHNILKQLHTIKGDVSQFEFRNMELTIHQIENEVIEIQEDQDLKKVLIDEKNIIKRIESIYNKELLHVKNELGEEFFNLRKTISIMKDDFLKIENYIKVGSFKESKKEILNFMKKLKYVDLKDQFRSYVEYTQNIARSQGKKVDFVFEYKKNIYIDLNHYKDFIGSLIHIFRNIVDHGIEDANERLEKEKNIISLIQCKIGINKNNIEISIKDDGKGLDFEKIVNKAKSQGLISDKLLKSELEVYEMIFNEGFSTNEKVSMISGRGEGLATVKDEIERIKGSKMVYSEKDRGTEFVFLLPISDYIVY